jgi:hypothetical protein
MNTKNEAQKHTPGPWKTSYDSYGDEIWFGGEGWGTWMVGPAYIGGQGDTGPGREEMDADARLISAAPEMLDVLQILEALDFGENADILVYNTACQKARAVIAKATGLKGL